MDSCVRMSITATKFRTDVQCLASLCWLAPSSKFSFDTGQGRVKGMLHEPQPLGEKVPFHQTCLFLLWDRGSTYPFLMVTPLPPPPPSNITGDLVFFTLLCVQLPGPGK